MDYKIITDSNGFDLIEHVLQQGLLNNGFRSKEDLQERFPDHKMNMTYINSERVSRLYAIKNTKTNQRIFNLTLFDNEFFYTKEKAENALKRYSIYHHNFTTYNRSDHIVLHDEKQFLNDNSPEDLKIVCYYMVEE